VPFREKIAWISGVAVFVVFGGYFWVLAQVWDFNGGGAASIGLLIAAIIALVVLMTGSSILVALFSPREANAPADEREQLIELRAERVASYVLSTCVVCLIGALLLNWNGYLIANLLLAAMVLAELTKAAAQIIAYRTRV
jgi:hypothetical protein